MTRILTRVLVALLPLTVLFGTYAAVGPLTSFRADVAALAVIALIKGTSWPRQWPLIIFGLAWVVVGVVSGLMVSWTPAWGDLANLVKKNKIELKKKNIKLYIIDKLSQF